MGGRQQNRVRTSSRAGVVSSRKQLARFLSRYDPHVAALAEAALEKMRARLPGAVELVYDNYNALAVGFGSGERASDLILSITAYPRWVSLFFTHGADLPDPQRLLKGDGSRIRHIVLDDLSTLDTPAVKALVARAVERASKPIDSSTPNRTIIKSVSARQRPRRPASNANAARRRPARAK